MRMCKLLGRRMSENVLLVRHHDTDNGVREIRKKDLTN